MVPLFQHAQSIVDTLQRLNGLYSMPVLAAFLAAVFMRKVSAHAVKIGIAFGAALYARVHLRLVAAALHPSDGDHAGLDPARHARRRPPWRRGPSWPPSRPDAQVWAMADRAGRPAWMEATLAAAPSDADCRDPEFATTARARPRRRTARCARGLARWPAACAGPASRPMAATASMHRSVGRIETAVGQRGDRCRHDPCGSISPPSRCRRSRRHASTISARASNLACASATGSAAASACADNWCWSRSTPRGRVLDATMCKPPPRSMRCMPMPPNGRRWASRSRRRRRDIRGLGADCAAASRCACIATDDANAAQVPCRCSAMTQQRRLVACASKAIMRNRTYTLLVDVFVRGHGIVRNRVTDPYSLSLDADSRHSWIGIARSRRHEARRLGCRSQPGADRGGDRHAHLRTAPARFLGQRRQRAGRRIAASTSPSPTSTPTACAICARWPRPA